MSKFALYVPLEAKPGKEKEVADFLRNGVAAGVTWLIRLRSLLQHSTEKSQIVLVQLGIDRP